MLPIAAMLDSPPRSTHHGERPSLLRREMILRCCGRYEIRMPSTRNPASETVYGFGLRRCSHWSLEETRAAMVDELEGSCGLAEVYLVFYMIVAVFSRGDGRQ